MTANFQRNFTPGHPQGRRAFIASMARLGLSTGFALSLPFAHMLVRSAYAGTPLPDGARILASGLRFPEGPVAFKDGSVLVCESAGGRLTRVGLNGEKELVADVGGGPTGAAFGPDGALYVCNPGLGKWELVDGLLYPVGPAPDNSGGCIQRVDIKDGRVEIVYSEFEGNALGSPNDIVFDRSGGFWFTDTGKSHERCRQQGAIYYAKTDGSLIHRAAFPMISPNGIGLSPDGQRLYVADLMEGALLSFDVIEAGQLAETHGPMPGKLVARLEERLFVDGLAVEQNGTVCVATPINGGISCWLPDGQLRARVALPNTLVTNICFGGAELKTAYITLGGAGQLLALDWPRSGLRSAWREGSNL